MKRVHLDFSLKGNRSYVRGADMYKEIIKCLSQEFSLPSLSNFRLSMHKLTKRNCYLLLGETNQSLNAPQEYVANFSFNSGDTSFKGHIVEGDSIIECRYPYDEGELNKLMALDGNKINLLLGSPYSFIDTIVAMTKHLHYTTYPSSGEWLFTQLDLAQIPDKEIHDDLYIELTKNFNNLLTKSKITCSNTVIGNIYFSLVVKS